ncbi:hypothetical protein K4F52_001091 [Lecanicillium sp. MT-2017a]|nr:hypothetical protein K4F52_001091 [Lecanicillium sp. MT-2017a]
MSGDDRPSRLIDLPWEVRRLIIVAVLRGGGRRTTPSFSRKLIEKRERLRNCFEEHLPEVTNLYVPRHKNRYLHGNGLRATNRQLRYETNLVMREELETGKLEVPFVLDVMVVKDIGVFLTWMSFPYRPMHIKKLTINLRIVRPGTSTVPDEWVEVARYHDDELYSRWENSPTRWNVVIMAVVLYAFGCFSVKPDPARPPIRNNQQPSAARKVPSKNVPSAGKQTVGNAKASSKPLSGRRPKPSKFAMLPNLADHQSDTLDAYILPSPSYIIDEMYIDFKECEYDVQSKPILPADKDSSREASRFYKAGCVQFGRDVFRDFNAADPDKDYEELEDERDLISEGKYACHQLQEALCNILWARRLPGMRRSAYGPYLDVLARSVGEVSCSPCRGTPINILERHPRVWIDKEYVVHTAQLDPEGYSKATTERNLVREMASDSPNEDLIDDLRLLQIRRSHGWVEEDD